MLDCPSVFQLKRSVALMLCQIGFQQEPLPQISLETADSLDGWGGGHPSYGGEMAE